MHTMALQSLYFLSKSIDQCRLCLESILLEETIQKMQSIDSESNYNLMKNQCFVFSEYLIFMHLFALSVVISSYLQDDAYSALMKK